MSRASACAAAPTCWAQSLITGALMLAVYTIVQASEHGFGAARTLVLGAISLALLAGFIAREATTRTPLVPLRIFRSRNVSGANIVQMLMVAGLFGMFFLGALYLQGVLGYDAVETGLAFLPVSVGIGVLSLGFSARLMARFGERATLLPGLALVAAGLLLFSRAPVDASYVSDVLPSMILLGVGAGLSFPALMTLAMSGATPEDSGLASGVINTTMQVGGALGLAVLATLASTRTDELLSGGELHGLGAHRRLPARLRGRRGARAGRAGRRDHGAARAGGGGGRGGGRARGGGGLGGGLAPRLPEEALHPAQEVAPVLEEEAVRGVGVDLEARVRDHAREVALVRHRQRAVELAAADQHGQLEAARVAAGRVLPGEPGARRAELQ